MPEHKSISPWRVLVPVSVGTWLSLMGDATVYTVLPTHTGDAGITLASVGIILSANRFIRLILNSPAGLAYDRWPSRPLFVTSLFIGACSTAIYAFTSGFWPLLMGRLIWGAAWAGIWVGGNTIIIDMSLQHSRGRWVGIYNISFYLGASTGSLTGGFLTDWLGYSSALGIGAALTLLGALVNLIFTPETSFLRKEAIFAGETQVAHVALKSERRTEIAWALALNGFNRLAIAGILSSTFGLLLLEQLGESIRIGSQTFGVASITGLGLGASYLVSMLSAPLMGQVSDRLRSRWKAAAGGLVPGIAGFALLSIGSPLAIVFGMPLTAFSGGSNQGLATTLVGDASAMRHRGKTIGLLATIGDLASAIGPPLAYALFPIVGLRSLYIFSSALFFFICMASWARARRAKSNTRNQP
jgi:MFS family permease